MKKLLVFSAVLFLSISACKKVDSTSTELVEIESKASFDEKVESGVSMMFFHASWCSICKAQKPYVEEAATLESLEDVFFGEVEFEDHSDITSERNVSGFPTTVIYKDGVEQTRLNGKGHDTETLENLLKTYL